MTDSLDELFEDKFDTLEAHLHRKEVLSDEELYRTLYYVYENGRSQVSELPTDGIGPLLWSEMLVIVPSPGGIPGEVDDDDIVKITRIGKDEIERDLEMLRDDA